LERQKNLINMGKATARPGETLPTPEAARADADAAKKRYDSLFDMRPKVVMAYAVAEGKPADVRVQKKGDPRQLGETVPRGFLQILGGQKLSPGEKLSGRLQLAGWLTESANPLTARVMANRIWQHHFGKGLVRTPNDFGARGLPPAHPELLDYLASRFLEPASRYAEQRGRRAEDGMGWSVKAMHRLVMRARAY